jgi:DNA polymerase-3 subunit beta
MIFTVEAKDFRAAMQIAGRVIPQKSPWPVLTNIKIVTNDSRVTLIGSDGDTTFEADVPADVETEGVACVAFGALSKFVGAAKADRVKVSVDSTAAKALAGRSRISLSAGNTEDYPNYRPPEGSPVAIDKETFCAALRFAVAASSDEEMRYHIAGPNFSEGVGCVDVWGTDGRSAHHAMIADLDAIGGGGTIPMEGAHVALAVADKAEDIAFMISERGWHLAAKGVRVWGKVIDAGYPDMAKVVSQFSGWRDVLVASKEDLTGAVNIATIGADQDSTKSRNIVLRASDGAPAILRGQKATSGVLHAGRAETDAEACGDFIGTISAKYLTGALGGIGCDDVVIEGAVDEADMGRAIRIRPAQKSNTLEMSALVMAMRVSMEEMADV